MPAIDVVDSTWISARPSVVAAVVAEPSNWQRWWPDLDLTLHEWRGDKGVRWIVRGSAAGYVGSMELWLEAAHDGVVAHYFLRLDAPDSHRTSRRRAMRAVDQYRRQAKQVLWAVADELDPGRIARISASGGL
ncbi:MAG: polyketide cyclase / dehydrase and lipid transport [Actinomycetota bacterium]|nr:polyketide cyclase / dehydrase and lipid transport [Actinomycetota bacterium]